MVGSVGSSNMLLASVGSDAENFCVGTRPTTSVLAAGSTKARNTSLNAKVLVRILPSLSPYTKARDPSDGHRHCSDLTCSNCADLGIETCLNSMDLTISGGHNMLYASKTALGGTSFFLDGSFSNGQTRSNNILTRCTRRILAGAGPFLSSKRRLMSLGTCGPSATR